MKIKASVEMVQDIHSNLAMIRGLTRSAITDEEINHWQALNSMINERFVPGARIQTEDFTDEELATYSRLYERYPAGMIIRTPDFTEEEIKGWQEAYKQINAMNLHEIKKKVHFLHEEEFIPYQEVDEWMKDYFPPPPKKQAEVPLGPYGKNNWDDIFKNISDMF